MGVFIISMPAIGYYGHIKGYVFKPPPSRKPTNPCVYKITESNGPVDLGPKEYAKIRLLSHAQMYRQQLLKYKIDALFKPLPTSKEEIIYTWNVLKLKCLNDFITVLEDPETIFYV